MFPKLLPVAILHGTALYLVTFFSFLQDNLLVEVPSMERNLRSLALGVSAGKALLLQGPVGCGKTTLVEHLAALTGRNKTPTLMKIQLGDQTDSKVWNS